MNKGSQLSLDTVMERGEKQDEEKSLMEKLNDHYHTRPTVGGKAKQLARAWFQFQGITQFYMTMAYIVPYIFADFDDMIQYYFKIFVSYMFIMTQANWLCAILYGSYLPDMRDRAYLNINTWFDKPPNKFGENGHRIEFDTSDKNGLSWKFCEICDRYRPPRAHHCDYCKGCILRRDHHCYMIGTCIGHYNQRYFIVLNFLVVCISALGFPMTVYYLLSLDGAEWWAHYALPYAIIRFFYWEISWQFLLLVFHTHMLVTFGCIAAVYFCTQVSIVAAGRTLYEVAKQVDVRVTTSINDNFRLVFGDYWMLNFLFPAQIIFKQRNDGIHYDGVKIFEKSNDKKK